MTNLLRCLFAATLCLALASYLSAQTTTKTDHKKPHTEQMDEHASARPAAKVDKALLQKVWDAWSTLKPENAAKFYSKGPEHVFFDIAPLKYNGWTQYEQGAVQVLSGFKSAKFTVNDDARIHNAGGWAWSTATVHGDIVGTDGKPQSLEARWTAVWEHDEGVWSIAHEHVSVPMK